MGAAGILERIAARKIDEVAAAKAAVPSAQIEAMARDAPRARPFRNALRGAAEAGYGLIAEIKRASPSRGVIREDFDPPALARAYEAGGAACLSVLTDGPGFQGSAAHLKAARAACALPALRKDFMLDAYQVAEARAWGADCILIIMAMVDDACAAALREAADRWWMDVLVEVHNAEEMDRAAALDAPMIGINNRNLDTFETSLEVTRSLSGRAPAGCLTVSESGLSTPEDLADMARHGARCFLVGEALMRQPDVEAATRALLAAPQTEDSP